MLSTLKELVEAGLAQLPSSLVGAAPRDDLRAIPDSMPRACTVGVFECRLDEAVQVDLTVGLDRRSFAGLGQPWPASLNELGPVAAFLDGWITHDTTLREHVERVWLSFDRDGQEGSDQPFLYFAPESGAEPGPVIAAALEVLDPECSPDTQAAIARCVAMLPVGGSLLLVAPTGHRLPDSVRLTVRLDARDLPRYLERVEWPGDHERLQSVLSEMGAEDWWIPLQLDVCKEVQPRLSLEFFDEARPISDPRWKRVLDRIEDWGACTKAKRAAIEAWCSDTTSEAGVSRDLDLKVSLDGNGVPRAKAYFFVGREQTFFG